MLSEISHWVKRVRDWWKEGLIAIGTSLAVAALVYLATGRNGDLVAWVSQQTAIYPSDQTNNLPLPLTLSQTVVESLTFVKMQVSNAGKASIGTQEGTWTLSITGAAGTTLVSVGDALRSSDRIVVTPAPSPSTNTIVFRVGLLEPREFFETRFIVANAPPGRFLAFQVDTSLKGLPPPILADSAPEKRAARKVVPWIWGALFALLILEAIRDRHHPEKGPGIVRDVSDWRLRLIVRAVIGIFLSAAASWMIAEGIGWTAIKLWRMGVLA